MGIFGTNNALHRGIGGFWNNPNVPIRKRLSVLKEDLGHG